MFYSKTSVFYLKRVRCSSFYLKNLCFISIKRNQYNPDPPGARYRDLVFFWQAKTFLYFRKQGTGSQLIYKSCCVCLCGFLVRQNKPAIKRQDSGGRDGSWKNILLLKPFYCAFLLSGIKNTRKNKTRKYGMKNAKYEPFSGFVFLRGILIASRASSDFLRITIQGSHKILVRLKIRQIFGWSQGSFRSPLGHIQILPYWPL